MSTDTSLLSLLIAAPFAGSAAVMLFPPKARSFAVWLAGIVALGALVLACRMYGVVAAGAFARIDFKWLPRVDFALRLDGYAWLFSIVLHILKLLKCCRGP